MLRTKELLEATEVGKLLPRWIKVGRPLSCGRPTVNVDLLKHCFLRAVRLPSPCPVIDQGQAGECVPVVKQRQDLLPGAMAGHCCCTPTPKDPKGSTMCRYCAARARSRRARSITAPICGPTLPTPTWLGCGARGCAGPRLRHP